MHLASTLVQLSMVRNITLAKLLILRKGICVNGIIVYEPTLELSEGDILTMNPAVRRGSLSNRTRSWFGKPQSYNTVIVRKDSVILQLKQEVRQQRALGTVFYI